MPRRQQSGRRLDVLSGKWDDGYTHGWASDVA
jgi:hypothetical protein